MFFFLGRFNWPRSLSEMNKVSLFSASDLLRTSLKVRDCHSLLSSKNSIHHVPQVLYSPFDLLGVSGHCLDLLPVHWIGLHSWKYLRNLTAIVHRPFPYLKQKRQQAESGIAPSTVAFCLPDFSGLFLKRLSTLLSLTYVLPYLLNIVKYFYVFFFLLTYSYKTDIILLWVYTSKSNRHYRTLSLLS